MMTEEQLLQKARKVAAQANALTFLNNLGLMPTAMKFSHTDSCASQDMTGYPAPCTCGAEENVRVIHYLKSLVLNDS